MSVYRTAAEPTRWAVTIRAKMSGPISVSEVEITQVVDAPSKEAAERAVVDGHKSQGWNVMAVIGSRPETP